MKLEERICACGCGSRFRVLPSAPNRFASQACEGLMTEGGLKAVLHKNRKRVALKEIPADAKGQVSALDLAGIIGTTYANVYNWTRIGRIHAIEGTGERAKKYDLQQVRRDLAKHRERSKSA